MIGVRSLFFLRQDSIADPTFRLFMQTTTDDASHDEALSSRVAALNMLDLGLGHLGIEVGEAVNELELNAVVKACGDSKSLIIVLLLLLTHPFDQKCCPNWMLVAALAINRQF